MATHPDVLIIGAGAIGLSTAYFLASEGLSVSLVDQAQPGTEASWAGAGIIPPGNRLPASSPFDRLRAYSSSLFPKLSRTLLDETGIDNGFRKCGGIELFDAEPIAEKQLWVQEEIEFQTYSRENGETQLTLPPGDHYLIPEMGQVRNPWHLQALIKACQQLKVTFRTETQITSFELDQGKVIAGITACDERLVAKQFLVANGAWADRLLVSIDIRLGVAPVRGQIVLFRPRSPLLHRIVISGKCYLVPREDGRILAGATEEPEAGFEKANTPEGVKNLIDFATTLVPALREAPIEKTWSGLRPGTPDGLPYLGKVPRFDNLYFAGGHFRAGIQLSPATAVLMRDLILGRQPKISINEFRLDRPPSPPFVTAFRS